MIDPYCTQCSKKKEEKKKKKHIAYRDYFYSWRTYETDIRGNLVMSDGFKHHESCAKCIYVEVYVCECAGGGNPTI